MPSPWSLSDKLIFKNVSRRRVLAEGGQEPRATRRPAAASPRWSAAEPAQGTDFFPPFFSFALCFCRTIRWHEGCFLDFFAVLFGQVIEKEAKNFIDESFKTLRSAEAAFDMLLKFKHIRSREAINRQMMMKFNDILVQYCKEVSDKTCRRWSVNSPATVCLSPTFRAPVALPHARGPRSTGATAQPALCRWSIE